MSSGITAAATYNKVIEAEVARGRLQALGIDAVILKDNCGDTNPALDILVGVRVMVPDSDLERAREILSVPVPATVGHWACPDCSETNEGGFDTCWSCGRARD